MNQLCLAVFSSSLAFLRLSSLRRSFQNLFWKERVRSIHVLCKMGHDQATHVHAKLSEMSGEQLSTTRHGSIYPEHLVQTEGLWYRHLKTTYLVATLFCLASGTRGLTLARKLWLYRYFKRSQLYFSNATLREYRVIIQNVNMLRVAQVSSSQYSV